MKYNDHEFDPVTDEERAAREREEELARRIRREVLRVQSGEADEEIRADREREQAEEQSRQDEEDVEQPHPQQDVAFDARFFRFHLAHQSSRISPGTTGSYKSMPRRRSSSRMAEWVVWRKRCS